MKIKYCGPARDYSGYGEANRHDIAALVAAGVEVTTQIPTYCMEISDFGKLGEIATSRENRELATKIKILHTTPNVYNQFIEPGKYHIGRVFWETNRLPLDFAQKVEMMDEVWTGSRYNADAIRNAGVTKPIHIIPEAIDAEVPDVNVYETPEIPETTSYKFYSIFEWTERKNPLALLEAYWREFEGIEDVALCIKTYVDNFTPDKKHEIDNAIRQLKKRLNLSHYAPVYLFRGLMDRRQIYRFHKTFDCFVSAHRGEGWGVPQMEALLMGKPIISTNCGGIHEYLIDGIHAKLVPYRHVPVDNSRNKQWYTPDQQWAEIDGIALRTALRYAFEHKPEMTEIGIRGQKLVQTMFSLRTVGDLMAKRITEIANEPYQVDRQEPLGNSVPDGIQVGDIIIPEQVIEEKNERGKVGSQWTIPPLVKKNRIKVDYFATNNEPMEPQQ